MTALQCGEAADSKCLLNLYCKQWTRPESQGLPKVAEGRGEQQRFTNVGCSIGRTVQHGSMQGFLGLPMDVIEQAVADSEGDLEAAVDSLLQQAERQPDPATPKQGQPQPQTQQQQSKHVPLQQNGHLPWQDTPTPSGRHIHHLVCFLMPLTYLTGHCALLAKT